MKGNRLAADWKIEKDTYLEEFRMFDNVRKRENWGMRWSWGGSAIVRRCADWRLTRGESGGELLRKGAKWTRRQVQPAI